MSALILLPDVHGQLLFGDESLAALRTDVLPAVISLVGLLTQVQAAPDNQRKIQTTLETHSIFKLYKILQM